MLASNWQADIIGASLRVFFRCSAWLISRPCSAQPSEAGVLLYVRPCVGRAARSTGIDKCDVPLLRFHEADALCEEGNAAKRLGFSGIGASCPSDVRFMYVVFPHTDDKVAMAEVVTKAFRDSLNSLAVLDGKLMFCARG
jgi:citrate lyase beta subunit